MSNFSDINQKNNARSIQKNVTKSINNTNNSTNSENISVNNNDKKLNKDNKKDRSRLSAEFTAEDALNTWKNLPHEPTDPDVVGVKPTYKNELGWYVPYYYKDTKKYAGCIIIATKHGPYYSGPKTYEDYKKIVSKKK